MSLASRLMVFSPQDKFLFEFSKNSLLNAVQTEEINGEHRLTLLTSAHLEKEQRILTQDATLKWREYVVMGGDGQHEGSERPFNTYNCVWSIQHDFRLFKVDDVVGLDYPVSAAYALDRIMVETDRWSRGTVDLEVLSGADMTQTNGWNALQSLIANWGGELDVTIEVDATKIVSRKVDLYEAMGNQSATRRFDYARDMSSVRRKVDEEPVACRIRPYGKGERTIDDIDVKITIEEVNDGKDYLQNDAMVEYMKLPDGSGGWEYPTIEVANTSIEDEEELLEWGLSVLDEYTTPKVTYETTVMQLVSAGTDAMGIELGDRVQCVDRDFDSDGGVRIENRVKKIEIDLLDSSKTKLTLGNANQSYVNTLNEIVAHVNSDIKELDEAASTTADFLNNLLDNLNSQINATGGYVYVTDGQGIRTYDKRVSNPLVGAEADAVVEIKGGTIRIANSKTATGEWEWKSVFTSGYIAAELVTAAQLTAGSIGSASSGNYWNLDTGQFIMGNTAQIGSTTVSELVSNVNSKISSVSVQYAQNQSTTNAPSSGWSTTAPTWRSGYYIWQRTATTNSSGTTYSTPTCISGRNGSDAPESRNYITQTSAFDGWVPESYSGHTVTGGNLQMSKVDYGYNYVTYMPNPLNVSLIYDKELTVSAIVKGEAGKPYNVFAVILLKHGTPGDYSYGYQHYMCGEFTATGDWQTVKSTAVYTRSNFDFSGPTIDVGADIFTVGFGMSGYDEVGGSSGDLLIVRGKSAKLEVGDTATPWSAALEDNMGVDGVGVSEVIDQYYLSTSNTTQTGGSWQNSQPTWSSGKYIWTRSQITWSDGQVTTTTPILAEAINNANENAKSAQTAVTTLDGNLNQEGVFNRLTNNGQLQGLYMDGGNLYMNASYIKTGTMKAGRIESNGGESYWDLSTGQMRLYALGSNLKIGRISTGTGTVDSRVQSLIELGDGMKYTDKYGQVFNLYVDSYASQSGNVTYRNSHMKLTNTQGTAGFYLDTLSLQGSVKLSSDATFYINGGADSQNENRSRLVINNNGTRPMCDIYGTTRANVTSWSDRRMKEHIAYLSEDACEFIRSLRPALFSYKEGLQQSGRHLGFYAQDVSESEPDGWDTETVTQSADELLDYEPFSLDYTSLIAPLVAYAQSLERRIDQQQRQLDEQGKLIRRLTERLDKLEA